MESSTKDISKKKGTVSTTRPAKKRVLRKKRFKGTSGIVSVLIKLGYFLLLFVGLTAVWSLMAIFVLDTQVDTTNLFWSYLVAQIEPYDLFYVVGAFLLIWITAGLTRYFGVFRPKKYKKFVVLVEGVINLSLTVFVVMFALGISMVVVHLVFSRDITNIAAELNGDIKSLELIDDSSDIEKWILEDDDELEVVFEAGTQSKQLIRNELSKKENRGEYYKDIFSGLVPDSSYPRLEFKAESVFVYDEKLFISDVYNEEIEEISPELAWSLVSNYFETKIIREYPDFDLLTRDEYVEVMQERFDTRLSEYDKWIKDADEIIEETKEWIKRDRRNYELYGSSFWLEAEKEDKKLLKDWEEYRAELVEMRELMKDRESGMNTERGAFIPTNQIKIVVDESEYTYPTEYMCTLVHEYLHFASYRSTNDLDQFFDEGLTEYYTRSVIKEEFDLDNCNGYPVVSEIIDRMMEDLPHTGIQDVYFSKSNDDLEKILDDTYGKGFYRKNESNFNQIVYSYDKESMEAANSIMDQIGGERISRYWFNEE